MPSETLRYDVISTADTRGLKDTARDAGLASAAAKELSERLGTQSKSAQVSAQATIALAKSDKILRDAQLELAVAAGEVTRAEAEQGRAAEKAAIQTRVAGEAAKGAGGNFGLLASPMGAAIAAGVALSPVAVTLAAGLGGLGLAALGAAKDARAMHGVLSPLKAEVTDFQKSLKPEVLTLFGDGASIAESALKGLQPVAAATGKGLHSVLGEIGANFRSGEWRQFFGFMERTAGPDIQQLGRLFIDLANDIPPVLETLQPVATGLLKITDAIVRIPTVLDQVKQKTGANQPGFFGGTGLDRIREFISWGEKHIPAGNKSISDLIGLTGRANANTAGVAQGITATGTAAAQAAPKVGTLAGDMGLLNAAVASGNSQLAAYSDLWDKFVGKSVSDQQAILNIKAAFEGYNTAVTQSGRKSTAAQQAFLSIFTTLGSGLDTLQKNGASVAEINSLYTTNIDRLSKLHGLTPQQRADVQGLTKDYIAWASVTQGLPPKILAAAGALRDTLLLQLANGHRLVPSVKSDMDAFSDAVLKTGTKSRATAADRAALIRDLEKSGFSAQAAQGLVRDFQGQIDRLHGKTVDVNLATSGSGSIIITGTGINTRRIDTTTGTLRGPGGHTANGWLVSGGTPGVDSVPIMAMPGELVVPTRMVQAGLVDHLRGSIPGFAAGGVVGKVSGAETAAGGAEAAFGSLAAVAFAQSALKAVQAIASTGFLGAGFGTYAADIQAVLRAMGLPLSLTANWLRQIQTESGGNLRAVNLTDSNAQAGHPSVGILQLIPSTFQAYAGPYRNTPPLVNYGGGYVSLDPMAQIYAAIHYAWARYDGAMASVIGQGHGYDSGGYLPTGWSLAYNGTGRPEPVTPAGRGGTAAPVTIVIENHGVIGSQAETDRWLNEGIDRLARQGKLTYALRRSPSAA